MRFPDADHLSVKVPQGIWITLLFLKRYAVIRHVIVKSFSPWPFCVIPIGHSFALVAFIPLERRAVGDIVGIGSTEGCVGSAHAQLLPVINGWYAAKQQVQRRAQL